MGEGVIPCAGGNPISINSGIDFPTVAALVPKEEITSRTRRWWQRS